MVMLFLSLLYRKTFFDEKSFVQVFYEHILPPLPFLILAGFSRIKTIRIAGLIGATVGAIIAVIAPWISMMVAVINYSGGGVNFGLILLLLTMPIYLPVLMLIGYVSGVVIKPQ